MKLFRTPLLLAGLAAVALTAPAPAQASTSQESIFQDSVLTGWDQARRDRMLDELQALGVDTVRANVVWGQLAPNARSATKPTNFDASNSFTYPAPNWTPYDALMRGARARGINVLITATGPSPAWASECKGSWRTRRLCRPKPAEFGAFVTALGRRYRDVRQWSIWNEPNQGGWLTPQYRKTRRGVIPEAPHRYRRLVQAATRALQETGHGADRILLGETAPIGRKTGPLSKRHMYPVVFWRELSCLSSRGRRLTGRAARVRGCGKPQRLAVTGAAHHPYTKSAGRPPTDRGGSLDMPLASIRRLGTWLDRGARAGWLPRRGLPIYSTEFGLQTNPPDRYSGVSLGRQAAYLNRAEYMSWRYGRLQSYSQYLMSDDARTRTNDGFQTGLRFRSGRAKPSYAAYRLPIWAFKRGTAKYVWGMVRPARDGQTATVQSYNSRRRTWQTVVTLPVSKSKPFIYLRMKTSAKYFRIVWNGKVSRRALAG